MTDEQWPWPHWPADDSDKLELVDAVVNSNVDDLFALMWEPGSKYSAKVSELREDKEAKTSNWLPSEGDALALESVTEETNEPLPKSLAEMQGRCRKHMCSSSDMGISFTTEELQRCLRAEAGEAYELECCVATTATYGDKFRTVIRHRLKAEGKNKTRWTVEGIVVFSGGVNMIIKKAISKGAQNGLSKNFGNVQKALKCFATVEDDDEEDDDAREAEDDEPTMQHWARQILSDDIVSCMEPVATWIKASTKWGDPEPPEDRPSRLAWALAVGTLLLAIALVIAVLQALKLACYATLGRYATLLGWLDVPSSVVEVLVGVGLVALAQAGLQHGTALLGAKPAKRRPAPSRDSASRPHKGRAHRGARSHRNRSSSPKSPGEPGFRRQEFNKKAREWFRDNLKIKKFSCYVKRRAERAQTSIMTRKMHALGSQVNEDPFGTI